MKTFFSFTKSKLITFIIISVIFLYVSIMQDQVFEDANLLIQFFSILIIYLFISIIWFSFSSKKHAIMALGLFILFSGILYLINYTGTKAVNNIQAQCFKETNSSFKNIEVMKCMQNKGVKFYR